MTLNPQVGEIWQWSPDNSGIDIYTLLLLERRNDFTFACMDLKNGRVSRWSFDSTYADEWQQLVSI